MARTRYIPLARYPASWDNWEDEIAEPRVTISVIDEADVPQSTGLLDANGTPLYRVSQRARCGF